MSLKGKAGGAAGGKSRGGKERVRNARGRTASQVRWIERQLADPYVTRAKAEGYRARAAYKLMELDDAFKLIAGAQRVLDLGAAPGGWCQVVRQRAGKARLVAVDVLDMDPLEGVILLKGDLHDSATVEAAIALLEGQADLVLSDMAANTTGHKQTDHLRTMALVETAVDVAERTLAPGGSFVAKVLAGGADHALVARLKRLFGQVKHAKPPASRKDSSEWYVIAKNFKGAEV